MMSNEPLSTEALAALLETSATAATAACLDGRNRDTIAALGEPLAA